MPWTLFSGLWSLQHLDLRGNHLHQLQSHMFAELTSLQSLLLADNSLTTLDDGQLEVSVNNNGVETGSSGGSMNRGPELLGSPSGATKI